MLRQWKLLSSIQLVQSVAMGSGLFDFRWYSQAPCALVSVNMNVFVCVGRWLVFQFCLRLSVLDPSLIEGMYKFHRERGVFETGWYSVMPMVSVVLSVGSVGVFFIMS